ncbi:MAG TPA: 3-hydroxyacyl-CoA dehydrogenase NAD-binding domain-containing protein, partial [Rhizomicrobium sp.]
MTEAINVIGIAGAGVMGRGIAQLLARGGKRAILYDAVPGTAATAKAAILAGIEERIARGKAGEDELASCTRNIVIAGDLGDLAPCELVIEAIIETIEAKAGLFHALEAVCDDSCILATNTSSLSVTAIADVLRQPGRCAGLHF